MKTCDLSLATVVLGALAVSYSACGAKGEDNTVPGGEPRGTAGSVSSAGSVASAGAMSVATAGRSGSPGQPSGSAGAPAAVGGAYNTGAGGATTSFGGKSSGGAGAPVGGAGAPATGGCTVAAGTATELLIDDLDDENDAIAVLGSRVGYWYTYNDGTAVQVPAATAKFKGTAPGHGTVTPSLAATTSGPAFTSYGAGMGFSFRTIGTTNCPYDATAYSGIKFWAKANAGNMTGMTLTAMLKTPGTTPVANGGSCVATAAAPCEDHYALKPAPELTTTWAEYTITFASAATFGQNGFGAVVAFDKSKILAMQFQVTKGVAFDFSVDDITFF